MRMPRFGGSWWVLSAVVFLGCRDKAPSATPDPASSSANTAKSAKPEKTIPKTLDVAVVTTDRTEIPRVAHDPIVLQLPRVSGLENASIEAAVNALLTPEKILGESIDEVRAEAKEVKKADDLPTGVQGASFTVPWNRTGLLEIEASVELMGAYPSVQRFHLLVDLRTGKAIGAEAFRSARVPALVKTLQVEVDAELKAMHKAEPSLADLHDGETYEPAELGDVTIGDGNLTFHHDYGFPHAFLAAQPSGAFVRSCSVIRADLDPNGPLARACP